MKLTPLAIQTIATEAGLQNPKAWPQRKRDSTTVMILAFDQFGGRKMIELPRHAKEADVRKAASEQLIGA